MSSMNKKELTYNEVKGVFERLFISPITGAISLPDKDYIIYASLTEKQMMTMTDLARRCKKYEDAYNKSTSKFHWKLNHARQERELRDEFAHQLHLICKGQTNENQEIINRKDILTKESLEEITRSLQEKHLNILKTCSSKKTCCKWIRLGEVIDIKGISLTKGFFYVGDYFKIPHSYKEIMALDPGHRNYWEYNRNYKLSKIYGTVIHENLPISKENLKVVPFSSYLDMHPTHRFEYLEWLAGHRRISEISSETFHFYLLGLQLRMFIDDTTTENDRLEIINCSVDLFIQCQEERVFCLELVAFIDAAISNFFINKLEELVPKNVLPHLTLCREALILFPYNSNNGRIMENICRNIMCILNYNDSIQEYLLTDSFYVQFANMVESELIKMSYENNWEELQNVIKDHQNFSKYVQYCINRPKEHSLLRYDYVFNFRLFPTINSVGFFNQCLNNCFKRIVKRIDEYSILVSELPSQVSSSLSLFDTDFQNVHAKIHRFITEGEEFATIEKETDASEYTIDKDASENIHQVSLSEEKLAKVEKQTKQAQGLLSDIFKEDDEGIIEITHENDVILKILKILFTKACWLRNEVDLLCREYNIMTGSALEMINDYSYSKIEDAVIEDDGDTIIVTTEYKDQLI